MNSCLNCRSKFVKRWQRNFCSNLCQSNYRYKTYISSWKKGKTGRNTCIYTKNISKHIKRYLTEKFNNKCSKCGWNKKHQITKISPLEVDHIDGNANNNLEKNLRLLCPNCHALTPFYRNLNRGKGRKWRMDKYIKNS